MFEQLLGNNFFLAILAFGLVLIPAIIIHEFGHFIAAKSVGITILEFGIGFPPRMFKLFQWGETEFTMNWIPLGGFVLPLGEDFVKTLPPEQVEQARAKLAARMGDEKPKHDDVIYADMGEKPKNAPPDNTAPAEEINSMARALRQGATKPKTVNEVSPWARIWFMSAGAIFNMIAAVVFFIVASMAGVPQTIGERFAITTMESASPLAVAGLQVGDVIEGINGETFTTATEALQFIGTAQEPYTLTVRAIGSIINDNSIPMSEREAQARLIEPTEIRVAPLATPLTNVEPQGYVSINAISPNSPAETAGLQPDDLIVSMNGERTATLQALIDLTGANAGSAVTLEVLRDGETQTFTLTPRRNPPPNEGMIGIGIRQLYSETAFGISYQTVPLRELRPLPFNEAVAYGWQRTTTTLGLIAAFPVQLLSGSLTAEEARPVSVVGISNIGGQLLSDTIRENNASIFLNYIAIINIALAFTNLLPIPALDGGRILFVVIELIRGRPVKPEHENVVHMIGMALLLALAAVFIVADIVSPVNLPR
jgi:regulator of sigma E protease